MHTVVILKRQLLAGGFSPEGVPQGDLTEGCDRMYNYCVL